MVWSSAKRWKTFLRNFGKNVLLVRRRGVLRREDRDGELVIGSRSGVWRTRSARRKLVGQRRAVESTSFVGGVPWSMSVQGRSLRGGMLRFDGGGAPEEDQEEEPRKIDQIVLPRAFHTTNVNCQKHRFTEACFQPMPQGHRSCDGIPHNRSPSIRTTPSSHRSTPAFYSASIAPAAVRPRARRGSLSSGHSLPTVCTMCAAAHVSHGYGLKTWT